MTDEMMSLQALLEKSSDTDLLREMIGFAAHRLMELEVENLTGAAHGERSADRITHRNGYRDRDWETRAGTVELRIVVGPVSGPWLLMVDDWRRELLSEVLSEVR